MEKSHFRKIIKDRLEKEQYSLNLPLEIVQILNLDDSMVEIKIRDDAMIIKKTGETQYDETKVTKGESDDIF